LKKNSLVGLVTFVFCKEQIKNELKDIQTSVVKLGAGGSLGNKGAVCMRFIFADSSFCFVNCHLRAGFQPADAK